jgi:hypothetical protein
MSRIRLIALSVFAMFAVGAISASTASAEFTLGAKCEGAGIAAICFEKTAGEGLKEAVGTEPAKLTLESGVESLLEVPNLNLHITCTVSTGTATASQPEPLVKVPVFKELLIKFSTCNILEALGEKCKVKEPIETKDLSGELLPTEPRHIEIKPESGTAFWEFTITNTKECPATVLGINPVKGKLLCEFLPEAETTDATEQLVLCKHETNSETNLEFGSNPATFESEYEVGFELNWLYDLVLA